MCACMCACIARGRTPRPTPTCLRECDPLMEVEYAAGFKFDRWQGVHKLEGSAADPSYQQIAKLREDYGLYQGRVEGQTPGLPSMLRQPHIKGETPDKDLTPTESEQAESERGGTDLEESREGAEEGEVPGQEAFTGIRPRSLDTDSKSWRDARSQEAHEGAELAVPRSLGQGKLKAERGRGSQGAAKQPWVESSSSELRDESEGSTSRSGSARGHHCRGGYHTDRPRTPPQRPRPRGVSPRRSPRLHRAEKTEDLRRLPITSKPSNCQMDHSRSASEDERGRHPSRSSRSSSEWGRPEQRKRTREPTPPVDDFTAVSHKTNSILFTSGHPYIPRWVQIWATRDQDRFGVFRVNTTQNRRRRSGGEGGERSSPAESESS